MQGVCLNGTHPSLLTRLEPFSIFHVKLAVGIVCGQWTESTSVSVLFPEGQNAQISRCCESPAFFLEAHFHFASWPKLFPLCADSANIHAQVTRQSNLSGATQQWH